MSNSRHVTISDSSQGFFGFFLLLLLLLLLFFRWGGGGGGGGRHVTISGNVKYINSSQVFSLLFFQMGGGGGGGGGMHVCMRSALFAFITGTQNPRRPTFLLSIVFLGLDNVWSPRIQVFLSVLFL